MSMTHGTNSRSSEDAAPPRPPSVQSSSGSGSSSSKHVKCIGRYVLTGCTLGKGNFARVESAVHTLTRGKVAIKIIETDKIKEDYVRKNLLREAQLMRRLRHPNIIRLYETMKTNNLYCLVTEVAEGGELLSHVRSDFKEKRLSEATTRPFIRQLISALHHLHSVGVVHRDLKMENILLDKKKRNVKIVDFGLSNAAKPGALLQTHCGSPEYAAPELFIPGREYGAEVDVWSLGVNMYAMLVGKLPFRSPRQGTKRRQKLLEQITNGISESHEKEMAHLSPGAKDLIGRLLQPDPRKRTTLEGIMTHPWVTKEGTHPLSPYKQPTVDAGTQAAVVELMATVLELSAGEIKETVRRDRCDWIAAIYNLLMDQPEGRNILQRLITDDPADTLVDAATYQNSSAEHLRLSQGDTLDKTPSEVASILTGATAPGKNGYGHSMSVPSGEQDQYNSSTLPLTRKEKRRHQSQDLRPLGAPRALNPVQPPPGYMLRRASVSGGPYKSPEHHTGTHQPIIGDHGHHHHHHQTQHHHGNSGHGYHHRTSGSGRRLPMTPNEEPYYRHAPEIPVRPHSRAESAPDHPLPAPWRPTLAGRNQLTHPPAAGSPMAVSPNSSPPPQVRSPLPLEEHHGNKAKKPNFKEPLVSPLSLTKPFKKKGSLNPIRQKSATMGGKQHLSSSIDQLHMRGLSHPPLNPQAMSAVHPVHGHSRRQSLGQIPVGWASSNSFHQGGGGHRASGSASIMGLMKGGGPPLSPYASIQDDIHMGESGSTTSVAIKQDLFTMPVSGSPSPQGSVGPSPHASNSQFRSERGGGGGGGENYKVDPISGDLSHKRPHPYHPNHGHGHGHGHSRSLSAKPLRPHSMYDGQQLLPEMTNSVGYIGQGMEHHNHTNYNHDSGPEEKRGRKGSIGGLIGKLKPKSSKDKTPPISQH